MRTATSERRQQITLFLQILIVIGLSLEIYERQWLNVVVVSGILILTNMPSLLARRLAIFIPPEFELFTIAFIFATVNA